MEVAEGDKRTLSRGRKILDDYVKRYEAKIVEVLESEVSHHKVIDSVDYYGRIDKIIRWGGGIYVMEHKTTSKLGFTFCQQFALDHQVDGYDWLCKDKMGECAGVLIDAVLIAKTKFNCMRDIATRTEDDRKEFEAELVDIAANIRWANENHSYPKNKKLCRYYGECPYRDLCLYHGDERIVESRYKKSVWNAAKGKEVIENAKD